MRPATAAVPATTWTMTPGLGVPEMMPSRNCPLGSEVRMICDPFTFCSPLFCSVEVHQEGIC
jgi:hypothetical protein